MAYEYDIFLSYPRIDPIGPWVADVFDKELRRWLRAELGECRVFRDTEAIRAGDVWPERLADALHKSKLMIPIWCPTYFDSAWCTAELRTMRAREGALSLTRESERLIEPVGYSGYPYWDEQARRRQYHDFYKYSDLSPDFASDPEWREMIKDIRAICKCIEGRLNAPPAWCDDWPTLDPLTMGKPKFSSLRWP